MATLAEIKNSRKGRHAFSLWTQWILRPISPYAAWLCIKLGMSANQVTIFGGIIGTTGCVLLAFGGYQMIITGAFLILLYRFLDSTDGSIARVTGTASNYGYFLDVIIDSIIYGLIPLSVGFGLYFKTGIWLYLFIGGLYTFSQLLGNVVTLAYDANFPIKFLTITDNRLIKWGIRIITLEIPVLIVCAALNRLEIFLGLFASLTVGKTITVAFITLIKGREKVDET